jgi:amino acid transporter
VISLLLSLILGELWGTALAFSFLATAFTFGWIFMFAFANIALPFYYKKHRPQDFRIWKHVALPVVGTLLLIPAFVSPLLPFLPGFGKAGPVAPQIIATIPLTLIWIGIGVAIAFRRYRRDTEDELQTFDEITTAGDEGA